MKNEKEIRYADLFGGVGGFRLGIERAINGSKCAFYCDNNKYAVQTYNKNFKENYEATDIRTIKTDSIPEIDMLCGGFPCQAFSIAGKRRGFQDTRGTLFFEIARIIKAKRPKIVFLENVKGLLNHNKGQTFSIIIQTLSELGYEVQWMVLNSKFFGVPQNRERVFIIGSLRGEPRPEILPFKELNEITNEESIPGIPTSQSLLAGYYKGGKGTHIKAVLTPDRENKRQNGRRFKSPGEPMFTLTGQDIHGIAYCKDSSGLKWVIRRLIPLEFERLQGFPDNWTEGVSDTQRYIQMGNAVTVNVIEAIMRNIN